MISIQFLIRLVILLKVIVCLQVFKTIENKWEDLFYHQFLSIKSLSWISFIKWLQNMPKLNFKKI